ncbi:MAG TPA: MmcQ/YjbR family DNA-binding protein [Polyangiales bacterium]
MATSWKQIVAIGRALPEVTEDLWYRTPSLKVRGKGFVRLREDGENVVFVLDSLEEQAFLIESQPKVFHITDHYRGHAMVLARLAQLSIETCRERVEQAWLARAPRSLISSIKTQRARR